MLSQNGIWLKPSTAVAKQATKPSILSETDGLNKALAFVNAKQYKWEIRGEDNVLQEVTGNPTATYFPTATLVYYAGEQEVDPAKLRLAYKFNIYAILPISRQWVFVDAIDGKILGTRNIIHTVNSSGTAQTAYSGIRPITTDDTGIIGNQRYRLRESGRGNGIQTLNMRGVNSRNFAGATDFVDNDNSWDNVNADHDQFATDAHWGQERTYDYYFTRFHRNSIG